jgi:para-nitrobenzyl esterase
MQGESIGVPVTRRGLIKAGFGVAAFREDGPVVTTQEGQLRGIATEKLHIFKGIRYGETTAGANRFRALVPVAPWEGVRDATKLGNQAYQIQDTWEPWKEDGGSEDCLVLNVWSPIGAEKKPVMVWIHGGGYRYGSGGAPAYDCGHLAERGEVVTVSVNHRLNIFGFLHLADLSDKFSNASNVGLLDLAESLRWIQRNIAAFGGDPDNVTIFGQSGGGKKVTCLMSMPEAKGLFHKAILMSGSEYTIKTAEAGTADAERVLEHFKIGKDNVEMLQDIPAEKLYQCFLDMHARDPNGRFAEPVVHPSSIPFQPSSPAANELSKDVPLMVGTTEEESTYFLLFKDMLKDPVDDAGIAAATAAYFPKMDELDKAKLPALIKAYGERRLPDGDPTRLLIAVTSDLQFGRYAIIQAENRLKAAAAPAYHYIFGFKDPYLGSAYAVHGTEVLFVLDHLDLNEVWGEEGIQEMRNKIDPEGKRYELRDATVDAWTRFARDGKPSSSKLPEWPAYNLENRPTMRFDLESTVVNDLLGKEAHDLLTGMSL